MLFSLLMQSSRHRRSWCIAILAAEQSWQNIIDFKGICDNFYIAYHKSRSIEDTRQLNNRKMKFENSVVAIALASLIAPSSAFQPNGISFRAAQGQRQQTKRMVTAPEVEEETATAGSSEHESSGVKSLTMDIVKKMRFREVQKELERKELDTAGTFTDMRSRLKELVIDDVGTSESSGINEAERVIEEDALNKVSKSLCVGLMSRVRPIAEDTFLNCFMSENYANASILHVVIYRRFNQQVSLSKMILIQILNLTA
jgi:hypothetical protein